MAGLIKRGKTYYVVLTSGGRQTRRSLRTGTYQVALAQKREIEAKAAVAGVSVLPTRTPIGDVVGAYIEHMKAHRPERSWRKDMTHLREAFGTCCPALEMGSNRARRCRELRCPEDRRKKLHPLAAGCFEEIATAMVADFIVDRVRARGWAPKTANRYREVVAKVFNWAMNTDRVRLPLDRNPAARVARYREPAPTIRYLTLAQIDEQLVTLEDRPQLQAMVAMYIYAGLRREEALWLTTADVDLHAGTSGMIRVQAKTADGVSWQPKTGSNRAVPISRDLARHLLRYRPGPSIGGWYFPSPQGSRWDRDNFSRTLADNQRRAGLRWACLDFRHTLGSQLAQNGVSLFKIATLMGNSPEICRRHYAALTPKAMEQDVEFAAVDKKPQFSLVRG